MNRLTGHKFVFIIKVSMKYLVALTIIATKYFAWEFSLNIFFSSVLNVKVIYKILMFH